MLAATTPVSQCRVVTHKAQTDQTCGYAINGRMLALETFTGTPHGALVYKSFCVWIKMHLQLLIEQLTQLKITFYTDYLGII
jgi:hypothetical protein